MISTWEKNRLSPVWWERAASFPTNSCFGDAAAKIHKKWSRFSIDKNHAHAQNNLKYTFAEEGTRRRLYEAATTSAHMRSNTWRATRRLYEQHCWMGSFAWRQRFSRFKIQTGCPKSCSSFRKTKSHSIEFVEARKSCDIQCLSEPETYVLATNGWKITRDNWENASVQILTLTIFVQSPICFSVQSTQIIVCQT